METTGAFLFAVYFVLCLITCFYEIKEWLSWRGVPKSLRHIIPDYGSRIFMHWIIFGAAFLYFEVSPGFKHSWVLIAFVHALAAIAVKKWWIDECFLPISDPKFRGWHVSNGVLKGYHDPLCFKYPTWHRTEHWIPISAQRETHRKKHIKPVYGYDATSDGYSRHGERMLILEVDLDRPVYYCPIDYHERADRVEKELKGLARSLLDRGASRDEIEQAFNSYQSDGVVVTLCSFTLFEGVSLLKSDLLAT